MKKRLVIQVLTILAIVSIAVIAFVSFSSKLYALKNGHWYRVDGVDVGCIKTGDECVWGAPSTDY